jgi:hypothetical protein
MVEITRKSFVDQVVKSSSQPVHFIVCRDAQGHMVHYFLKITPEKLRLLQRSSEDNVEIAQYGAVLASGYGREPTEATKRQLKNEYGYDYDAQAG